MAQRRKPQASRLRKLLVYIFVPLFVWLSGFVIWFYWYDLHALLTRPTDPTPQPKVTRPVDRTDKAERPPAKRPQEKIFDNERKKLEDIIKRQQ